MADDLPGGQVRHGGAEGVHKALGRTAVTEILGGVAQVQEVCGGIEDGDGLNRAALAVNRVGGVHVAGAASVANMRLKWPPELPPVTPNRCGSTPY